MILKAVLFSSLAAAVQEFTVPEMEAFNSGPTVAPELRCAACQAVAHQVQKAFRAEQEKDGARTLKETGVYAAIETACNAGMLGYGVKAVGASAVLGGEGTPGDALPGPHVGDAGWDHRMARFCKGVVGDVGEEDMYADFADGKNMTEQLCLQHTRHCRRRPRLEARRAESANSVKAGNKACTSLESKMEIQASEIARLSLAEQRLLATVERLELILARVERTQNAIKSAVCTPGAPTADSRLCTHGVDIVQKLKVQIN